mgnify:CR=1 FL=1
MNNNTKNSDSLIPEKVLELLPWYAIGKLSVDDQALFEQALVTHPSLQTLLEQEQTMITKVSVDKSILEKSAIAPTEERLKSVLNMIDLEGSQENIKLTMPSDLALIENILRRQSSIKYQCQL